MASFGNGSYLHLEQFNEESSGLTRHGFLYHNGRNIPLRDADVACEIPPGREYPTRFTIRLFDHEGGTPISPARSASPLPSSSDAVTSASPTAPSGTPTATKLWASSNTGSRSEVGYNFFVSVRRCRNWQTQQT